MYPPRSVAEVLALFAGGISPSAISRITGVPRSTVRDWVAGRIPSRPGVSTCMVCRGTTDQLAPGPYAYLLGLYLGDGYIARHRRDVYKLRITCCDAYPSLIDECALVMAEILPNRVGRAHRTGCTEVYSYSKHWPCLLPQHGPGHKHHRAIALADWQRAIVERVRLPFSEDSSTRTVVGSSTTSAVGCTPDTSSPMLHPTSSVCSLPHVTGWAWSGGRGTPGPCLWPSVPVCSGWTSSSGPSASGPDRILHDLPVT